MKAARKQIYDEGPIFDFMLGMLPREWVPFRVLDILYGINEGDEALWGGFRAWSLNQRQPRKVIEADRINRHAFEIYLQRSHFLPLKAAAARVGMASKSLLDTIDALKRKNLLAYDPVQFSAQIVPEAFIRSIDEYFSDLRHRGRSDHSRYCKALHLAIRKDLGVKVADIRCISSQTLKQKPADYAYEYDCLTGDPIGLRYQVWLDFKKPMYLRPDACSSKTYLEHESKLSDFVFAGQKPKIPPELKKYLK